MLSSLAPSTFLQIRPFVYCPFQIYRHSPPPDLHFRPGAPPWSRRLVAKSQATQENGIPIEDVKTLAKFRSRYNYIRVLEVSRRSDHPFRGSRLLLLDRPGNIHSITFLFDLLTNTYFDVFATLPPILPPGSVAILGFGAGSAARLILELYPEVVVHGWEIDPSVVSVGREFFEVEKLERLHPDRLFINIGNALEASVEGGFSGIFVDLFSKGCLIPELRDPKTWVKLRNSLRRGGRIMVNVAGSCVEAEDSSIDGDVVMKETLEAMYSVFGDKLFVLNLGNRKDDSSIALTGELPDLEAWKNALPESLKCYADMWRPFKVELSTFLKSKMAGWAKEIKYPAQSIQVKLPVMASTSQAKLVAAVVTVVLLPVVDFPATSAFSPYGVKGSTETSPCISRRMLSGKEDGFGCKSSQLGSNKMVPSRSLRSSIRSPPSPVGSHQKSMYVPGPPGAVQ